MRHTRFTCLVALLATMPAIGQTFSNTAFIGNNSGFGNAWPYPSTISVSGVSGPVGSISVTLHNVMASFSDDLVVGLRSPDGTVFPIVSHCGGNQFTGGNFVFVPRGLATPYSAAPGVCATNVCSSEFVLFGVTGPIGDLGDLIGAGNVNGVWSLYVADQGQNNSGVFVFDGWSITFGPVASAPASTAQAITYQGRIDGPNGPMNDEVIAGFRLFDSPTGGARLGAPLLMRVTPENGLFSVALDFGAERPFESDAPMWLEATLDGQVLSPRQRIAPAPRAVRATIATSALTASTASSATVAQSATTADSANTAGHAATADYATNAGTAANATYAASVAWTSLTSVPFNVASLRWTPAPLANSSSIAGAIGLGTDPVSSSRLVAHQNSLGTTQWHFEMTNAAALANRGGIRLNDSGFVEISNNAAATFSLFARLSSTGSWTVASDARLKTDVRSATGMLDAAMKLRPVYFHWLHGDANEDFGLIAQEAREVLPRLVSGDEAKESLTVNYSQLSVVAIGAIQELKERHDAELAAMVALMDARNNAQQEQIDALKDANEELLRRLDRLESGGQK